jgi:prepilin-type processing-associated H-X9-DG protein
MFADAAMCQGPPGKTYFTEESFAYCVFGFDARGQVATARRTPSIHFRHLSCANVAWCDGHATGRDDFHSATTNVYGANPQASLIGWFGPDDNSLFDLE